MNSRILPAFALLLGLLILFFYIRPTWNGSIASARAAIDLDNQALAAAAKYQNQQSSLASARAAIAPENLARLNAFLPDSVDNVGLVLDLNALAARSGLTLASIDVSTDATTRSSQSAVPVEKSPVGSISLSLSAIGTFNALQAFLTGVERSARLLDVQDLVVAGSDTGVYSYQLTLRLYWLR